MKLQKNVGWHHPTDESDQWDGFNEAGMEHFTGSPIQHLAREVHQNSLDAGDDGIVDVRIKLHQIKVSEIPNVDELRANLSSCYDASKQESKKAEQFFQAALAQLDQERIAVLEISDYNTRGMIGPAENGTPFYAFMKAKGQSRKGNSTATGSYGIGKFAPYAVSKLRTIFISTVYRDKSGEYVQLTQGKSILMSHDSDGKRRQGIGFWGVTDRCQPVSGVRSDAPTWMQRAVHEKDLGNESKGSTLTILGFDAVTNWQTHLAVSVAENFFGAISDGRLRVTIGDKHTLDQTSIYEFFEDDTVRESIKKLNDEPEQFDNCKTYLATHKGGIEVFTEESEQLHLGLCQLKVLVGENLPKKVCALRNGMFITDSLNGLKRFSDFKEFAAVFHCQSTKGNELLRSMEPPRHDDFEPARLSTKDDKKRGKKALDDLAEWIKSVLKTLAKDPVSDVTSIDELKDILGDEGEGDGGKGLEEINPYGEVIIRAKAIRTRVRVVNQVSDIQDDDSGDGDIGSDEGGNGGGGDQGAGGGDGAGGKGDSDQQGSGGGHGGGDDGLPRAMMDINNVRAIPIGSRSRRLAFTPVTSGSIILTVKEAGADSDYPVSISKSDQGELQGGGIAIKVKAGLRVNLEVELNQEFSGALKVVAHAI